MAVVAACSVRFRWAPSVCDHLAVGVCIRRADVHCPLVAAAWAATQPDTAEGLAQL